MPKVLPIMTNGSRATGPERFYHKRSEQRRSSAAQAKPLDWNGNPARGRWAMGNRAFTPFGGLRVTPHAPSRTLPVMILTATSSSTDGVSCCRITAS